MEEKREELIKENIEFAYWKAKKWDNKVYNLDYDRILSLCFLALVKAAKTFKFNKGVKFVSYAGICIDNEVKMELRKEKKTQNEFSITDFIREGKNNEYIDKEIKKKFSIESIDNNIINLLWLKRSISKLKERDKKIIKLYFIKNKREREIAEILNLSQSYINRLKNKACKKLKNME